MDYLHAAAMLLAGWAVLRNLGNERECRLREIEARIREESESEDAAGTSSQVSTSHRRDGSSPTKPAA